MGVVGRVWTACLLVVTAPVTPQLLPGLQLSIPFTGFQTTTFGRPATGSQFIPILSGGNAQLPPSGSFSAVFAGSGRPAAGGQFLPVLGGGGVAVRRSNRPVSSSLGQVSSRLEQVSRPVSSSLGPVRTVEATTDACLTGDGKQGRCRPGSDRLCAGLTSLIICGRSGATVSYCCPEPAAQPVLVRRPAEEVVTLVQTQTLTRTDVVTERPVLTQVVTQVVTERPVVTQVVTVTLTETLQQTLEPAVTIPSPTKTLDLPLTTVSLAPETVNLPPKTINLPPKTVNFSPEAFLSPQTQGSSTGFPRTPGATAELPIQTVLQPTRTVQPPLKTLALPVNIFLPPQPRPPASTSPPPTTGRPAEAPCGDGGAGWVALVGTRQRWMCAGALVAPRLVLTAARCVAGRPVSSLAVRLGESDLSSNNDGRPLDAVVLQVRSHPGAAGGRHDLALLKLSIDGGTTPVCLPAGSGRLSNLRTLGWGISPHSATPALSSTLSASSVLEVATADCDAAYRLFPTYKREFPGGVGETEVCVAARGADEAGRLCPQDRGGALVGSDRRGRITLWAVMREAAGCGSPVLPGLYTGLQPYLPWIRQALAQLA